MYLMSNTTVDAREWLIRKAQVKRVGENGSTQYSLSIQKPDGPSRGYAEEGLKRFIGGYAPDLLRICMPDYEEDHSKIKIVLKEV